MPFEDEEEMRKELEALENSIKENPVDTFAEAMSAFLDKEPQQIGRTNVLAAGGNALGGQSLQESTTGVSDTATIADDPLEFTSALKQSDDPNRRKLGAALEQKFLTSQMGQQQAQSRHRRRRAEKLRRRLQQRRQQEMAERQMEIDRRQQIRDDKRQFIEGLRDDMRQSQKEKRLAKKERRQRIQNLPGKIFDALEPYDLSRPESVKTAMSDIRQRFPKASEALIKSAFKRKIQARQAEGGSGGGSGGGGAGLSVEGVNTGSSGETTVQGQDLSSYTMGEQQPETPQQEETQEIVPNLEMPDTSLTDQGLFEHATGGVEAGSQANESAREVIGEAGLGTPTQGGGGDMITKEQYNKEGRRMWREYSDKVGLNPPAPDDFTPIAQEAMERMGGIEEGDKSAFRDKFFEVIKDKHTAENLTDDLGGLEQAIENMPAMQRNLDEVVENIAQKSQEDTEGINLTRRGAISLMRMYMKDELRKAKNRKGTVKASEFLDRITSENIEEEALKYLERGKADLEQDLQGLTQSTNKDKFLPEANSENSKATSDYTEGYQVMEYGPVGSFTNYFDKVEEKFEQGSDAESEGEDKEIEKDMKVFKKENQQTAMKQLKDLEKKYSSENVYPFQGQLSQFWENSMVSGVRRMLADQAKPYEVAAGEREKVGDLYDKEFYENTNMSKRARNDLEIKQISKILERVPLGKLEKVATAFPGQTGIRGAGSDGVPDEDANVFPRAYRNKNYNAILDEIDELGLQKDAATIWKSIQDSVWFEGPSSDTIGRSAADPSQLNGIVSKRLKNIPVAEGGLKGAKNPEEIRQILKNQDIVLSDADWLRGTNLTASKASYAFRYFDILQEGLMRARAFSKDGERIEDLISNTPAQNRKEALDWVIDRYQKKANKVLLGDNAVQGEVPVDLTEEHMNMMPNNRPKVLANDRFQFRKIIGNMNLQQRKEIAGVKGDTHNWHPFIEDNDVYQTTMDEITQIKTGLKTGLRHILRQIKTGQVSASAKDDRIEKIFNNMSLDSERAGSRRSVFKGYNR
jgi:hypothetical protein